MKLRDLVKATGVSRETIQFYLREGILPKPRKRDKNQAEYDESYVELLKTIKDLQDNHYLPLSIIKKIIKRKKKISPADEYLIWMQSELFSPVGQFLMEETVGEDAFIKMTGISRKWLKKSEDWGIITPQLKNGRKSYSYEDAAIGKLMVELDKAGFGPRDGFDPEVLKHYGDLLDDLLDRFNKRFAETYFDKLQEDELEEMGERGMSLMGLYFYLRYRKFARNDTREILHALREKREQGDD